MTPEQSGLHKSPGNASGAKCAPHKLGGHGLRIVRRGRGPDPDMVRAREKIGLTELAAWLLGGDDTTPLHPDWKRPD